MTVGIYNRWLLEHHPEALETFKVDSSDLSEFSDEEEGVLCTDPIESKLYSTLVLSEFLKLPELLLGRA